MTKTPGPTGLPKGRGGRASDGRRPRDSAPRSSKRDDPLSTTLASGALARLVIDLAVHPEETPHGRALQRRTGLTPRSLQTELRRLERLGILQRREDGTRVHYELNETNPRWRALRGLVQELADPMDVLRAALAEVPGVSAAFVFGSFVRGDVREDSDVDLFVLDDAVAQDALARRTLDAGVLLRREINVVQMTRKEMDRRIASGGGFIPGILREAKLWLLGNQDEFEATFATKRRSA